MNEQDACSETMEEQSKSFLHEKQTVADGSRIENDSTRKQSEIFFIQGISLVNERKWSEAEEFFRKATEIDNSVAEYYNKLAAALQHQGKREQEAGALTSAIKLDDRHATWHCRLGEAFLSMKRWVAAEEAFRNAIRRNRTVADYYNKLALALNHQGKRKEEIEVLDLAIKLDGSHADWHTRLTAAKTEIEKPVKAKKLFIHGEAYLTLGKWKDAEKAFRGAIELDNTLVEYPCGLATALQQQAKHVEAAKVLKTVVDLGAVDGKVHAHVYSGLATALQLQGKHGEAVKVLKTAVALGAGNARIHSQLGDIFTALMKWSDAETEYLLASELDESAFQYLDGLALALQHQNKFIQEVKILEVAAHREGGAARHYRLGQVRMLINMWSKAEESFAKCIEQEPNVAAHYNQLALALQQQKKRREEADALVKAIWLDARHATWHYRLGEALEATNCIDRAITAYQNAVGLKTDDANWFYRLGRTLAIDGREADALAAFQHAIQLADDQQAQLFGLGALHQKHENWEAAIHAYSQRLELDPLNAELHYRLGVVLARVFQWREAADVYRKAILLEPNIADWYCDLDFVLVRLGEAGQETQTYLEKITVDNDKMTDDLYIDCAGKLYQLGLVEQAYSLLTKIKVSTADVLLSQAEMDYYASRFDDAESKALRSMVNFSSKTQPEKRKKGFFILMDVLQAMGRDTEALHMLEKIPFSDSTNMYFRAIRRFYKSDQALKVYRSILVNYPKNVSGHDTCMNNYSILLRDSGLFTQSHEIARDRFIKTLNAGRFNSKKKAKSESWVQDAEIALFHLKKSFDKHGIEFFLISGTLLGCVRERGIIGHDKDIDVGFDERYSTDLVRNAMLDSPFFKLLDLPFDKNVYVQHYNGVLIDVFRHFKEDDLYWHEGIKSRWWNKPFNLVSVDFLGGTYLIPDDYDTYLTENYGGWKVPVSEFETFVDTPNMEITDKNQILWYYLTKLNDYYLEGKHAQFSRVWSAYSKLVDDPYLSKNIMIKYLTNRE